MNDNIPSQKRPIGIAIFSWYFIICGACGILMLLMNLLFYSLAGSFYAEILKPILTMPFAWVGIILWYIILPILGIFLLKSKEWARKTLLISTGLAIVISLVFIPHTIKAGKSYYELMISQIREQFSKIENSNPQEIEQTVKLMESLGNSPVLDVMIIANIIFISIFHGVIILYFMRKKVKVHFL